jgi:ribonucleoside-triphosphate reductase
MSKIEIAKRIEELQSELAGVKGGPTEVYARIVGYYRSVRNWNAGKREEFAKRARYQAKCRDLGEAAPDASHKDLAANERPVRAIDDKGTGGDEIEGKSYLLFTRRSCPNCPPVKELLSVSGLQGVEIDVDEGEGLEQARKWGVLSAPTAIILDGEGVERVRARSAQELRAARLGN